ncbi:MAG: flagellar motor protein MotB [Steroidobacteraceae bacterium]
MEDAPQPIIIKRIVAGHGHHGGGWKVAFADFATAMMAFFLLMWLMGSTSAAQKGGISQYFKNPSVAQGVSPAPSPTAVQGAGGPSSSLIDMGGSTERYKNPAPAEGKEDEDPTKKAANPDNAAAVAEAAETERLENLKEELTKAIDEEGSLKPFKDQIMMDLTPEGLRIQIVDKENRSMFDLGGATLKDYSLTVLLELAKAIQKVPNRVSISGHTDQSRYYRQNYGNWELSTDRANAARRALIAGGLPEEKIGRVVGLSSTALLDANNPQNSINRRISIVVMNARTEQAIKQESASLFSVQNSESSIGNNTGATAANVAPAIPAPVIGPPSLASTAK